MEEFKAQGNEAFRAGLYGEAIEAYTLAISLDPTNSLLFSNLSQAHYKLGLYEESCHDAGEAISLDTENGKAYLLYSRAVVHLFPKTLNYSILEQALEYCSEANHLFQLKNEPEPVNFAHLKIVKKHLETYDRLYTQDRHRENVQHLWDYYETKGLDPELLTRLKKVLTLPQPIVWKSLICPITYDYFNNPVNNSEGVCYEEREILRHMLNSQIDPLTRKRLEKFNLIPNNAIKEAIAYHKQHGNRDMWHLTNGEFPLPEF